MFRQTEEWLNGSGAGAMPNMQLSPMEIESKMPDYVRYRDLYYRNEKHHIQGVSAVEKPLPYQGRRDPIE